MHNTRCSRNIYISWIACFPVRKTIYSLIVAPPARPVNDADTTQRDGTTPDKKETYLLFAKHEMSKVRQQFLRPLQTGDVCFFTTRADQFIFCYLLSFSRNLNIPRPCNNTVFIIFLTGWSIGFVSYRRRAHYTVCFYRLTYIFNHGAVVTRLILV